MRTLKTKLIPTHKIAVCGVTVYLDDPTAIAWGGSWLTEWRFWGVLKLHSFIQLVNALLYPTYHVPAGPPYTVLEEYGEGNPPPKRAIKRITR